MQFIVTGHDGTDPKAPQRREKARAAHIAHTDQHRQSMIMGVALLDDAGLMKGSVLIVDFPSRADLDTWLQAEPYIMQKVWQTVSVRPCQVGPSFMPKT